jgi:tetratricopeptide (TPR) repeat protein
MITAHRGFRASVLTLAALIVIAAAAPLLSQPVKTASAATLRGYVRDPGHRPIADATVLLQLTNGSLAQGVPARVTHTNFEGAYRFSDLVAGTYTLSADITGYDRASIDSVRIASGETKELDLTLVSRKLPATTSKTPASVPELFDEPQFTVAGVTQTSESGGHGSDVVRRTTEALAKATVSLNGGSPEGGANKESVATETSLRDAVKREPDNYEANRRLGAMLAARTNPLEALSFLRHASSLNPNDAETHLLLGDVEEKLANPLNAVREYQRAAELDPSERNLFDWGTELLHHRAFEPATEVFVEGNRLFPNSARMLVALGVAWYSRGSYDQAAEYLAKASDLDPGNPTPYNFLGRMQTAEATASEEAVRRLARFAQLQPENALANYYYAVALSKQGTGDRELLERVETLLKKAVRLDPKLAAGHLQLGIFYSQQEDFAQAIAEYRNAIEVAPKLDDTLEVAHYRLAQAYRRIGDEAKARNEFQLHDKCAQKANEYVERERRETQQFVIALRDSDTITHPQH